MGFKDIFVPQWRHSDPKIRREALKGLLDVETLISIVINDKDLFIQKEALKQIEGKEQLDQLSKHPHLSPELRQDVLELLMRMEKEELFEEMALHPLTKDSPLLTKILHWNEEELIALIKNPKAHFTPEVMRELMKHISRPRFLFEAILTLEFKDYQDELLEQLKETHYLKRLSREASSKRIRKKALQQLEALIGPAKIPQAKIQQKLTHLVDDLEAFSLEFNPESLTDIKEKLEHEWEQYDPEKNHALREKFEKKLAHLEDKAISYKELLAQLDLDMATLNSWSIPLTEEQKELFHDIKERWPKSLQKFAHLPTVEGLLERFERLRFSLDSAQDNLYKQQREHQQAVKSLYAPVFEAERFMREKAHLLDEAAITLWKDIEKRWHGLFFEHPDTDGLKERFYKTKGAIEEKLGYLLQREEEITAVQEKAKELFEKLTHLLKGDEQVPLDKQVKAIQEEWKSLTQTGIRIEKELWQKFKEECDQFYRKQQDYWQDRQWVQWNAAQHKEEIIKKLKEALAQESLPIATLSHLLADDHARWKELGPAIREKEQELWDQFKEASDQGWQRCLHYKDELLEKLSTHLADLKEDISDEELQKVPFKELSPVIKALQEEWLAIGRLPKSLELEKHQTFQKLSQLFYDKRSLYFEKRDKLKAENLEKKKELLQILDAILEKQGPSNEKAKKLKELQLEWKQIGPTPHQEGQELWEKFQEKIQVFFNLFKEEKDRNLELKTELLTKTKEIIESLQHEDDFERVASELKAYQKQWKEIGPVPHEKQQETYEEFSGLCQSFFEKRKVKLEGQEDILEANRVKKEELAQKAQELSHSTNWKETAEYLKRLQEEWRQIGPVKNEGELWTNFRKGLDHFFTERQRHFHLLEQQKKENFTKKKEICQILKVLAHLTLPSDEVGPIPEEEMATHLKLALHYKQQIFDADPLRMRQNAIREVMLLQDRWKSIGPVPFEANDTLWKEYQKWGQIFFTSKKEEHGHGPSQEQSPLTSKELEK